MDQNSQDSLEQLISEIVADPKIRAEMEKIQPIDYEKNQKISLDIFPGLWYT